MRTGDHFAAGDGNGQSYLCHIESFSKKGLVYGQVEQLQASDPPLQLNVGVGLCKAERLEWLLEKAAELGVGSLTPLVTKFCTGGFRHERGLKIVRNSCALAGRAHLMKLQPSQPLELFLQSSSGVMFHQGAPKWQWECQRESETERQASPTPVSHICVGPEGGFSPEELEMAQQHGWTVRGLGPRNLRVETAALAVISLLTL